MDQTPAHFDLLRMLIGKDSPSFLIEIVIRTVVIYAFTLVFIRLIGQRAIGQLSLIEYLLVIALGSAVSDVMFYPQVPLLHSCLVIAVVLAFNKLMQLAGTRSEAFTEVLEGQPVELMRNGVITPGNLEKVKLSRKELFEQLRLKDVRQLGEVEACFFESSGHISSFKASPESIKPGLPIVPPWEIAQPAAVVGPIERGALLACMSCGLTCQAGDDRPATCANCGEDTWMSLDVARASRRKTGRIGSE